MKKTLITLLALGGLTFGATPSVETGNTTSAKSLTVTSSITLSNLKSIMTSESDVALISFYPVNLGKSWSIGVNTSNGTICEWDTANGDIGVSGTCNAFTWYDAEGDEISAPILSSTFSMENAVSAAITLGNNSSRVSGSTAKNQGTAVVFSVAYADGSTISIYGLNTNKYTINSHIPTVYYNSALLSEPIVTESTTPWTQTSLIAANTAALKSVPEPTTATLSLLALAGLCARRRRK